MNTKTFYNSHFTPKGDYEVNWNKAVGYIPLDKEIIIYKKDETHSAARFKVGDGKTVVQDLPFSGTDIEAIEKLIDEKGELLIEYVDNAVATIQPVQADYNQNDLAAADYIKNRPFYEKQIYPAVTYSWNKDTLLQDYDYVQDNSIDTPGLGLNGYWVKISDDIPLANSFINSKVRRMMTSGEVGAKTITPSDITTLEEKGMYVIKGGQDDYEKYYTILVIYDYELASASLGINYPGNGIYIAYLKKYHLCLLSIELREYHDIQQMDEKFLPNSIIEKNIEQDDKIAELEGRITKIFFNITKVPTEISFFDLQGATQIDWGDGNINNHWFHKYESAGLYQCRIYDAIRLHFVNEWNPDEKTDMKDAIKEIYVGNTVVHIPPNSFSYCSNCEKIILGSSVNNIDSYAFYYCKLTNIEIPNSVISIGNSAFNQCRSLTSVVIGNNVTSIGEAAFRNCDSLTSIIIPDSVTSIGGGAFSSCSNLTDIVIPDGVTSIGNGTFSSCSSLTNVVIPDSVTNIGAGAFEFCDSLTNVVIPKSVTSIGFEIFGYCKNLTSVIFKNPSPVYYNSYYPWFKNCPALTHIYVPYGCGQTYIDKWSVDGAPQDILEKIVESDREAMMSDIKAFNLEDGISIDSLQQKYSLALGARSIALGGAITTPEAEKSFAMAASIAKNNCVFAANEHTTAEGWASATFGGQTKTSYPYMFACGFNNENKEENIFEVGYGENKYEVVAEKPSYEQAMTELKYYRNLGDKGYERLTPMNCPTEEDYNAVSEVLELTGQGWNAFEVTKNGTAKLGDKLVATEAYVDGKIIELIGTPSLSIDPSQIIGAGQDSYTQTPYIRFGPTAEQEASLMNENVATIKLDLTQLGNQAPAAYVWVKRNTNVSIAGIDAIQFTAGGEQFYYDNYATDIVIKDIGNAALVYIPSLHICDISFASISIPDLYYKLGQLQTITKDSLVNNAETWTDEEKASACETIGAVEAIKESEITGSWFLYGTDEKGNRKLYKVLDGIGAKFIPIRDGWGGLDVPAPQKDSHATNRGYVDGLIAELLARIEALEAK